MKDFKNDLKLILSLIVWMIIPSIYLLIRMNIVAVNSVDINILGQMEWFDLIDEVITTVLVVPLYSLLSKEKSKYKNGIAFLTSVLIYLFFTIMIVRHITGITRFMNAEYAKEYLLLQTISLIFSFILTFVVLLLTINSDHKLVWILIIVKVIMLSICDSILIGKYKDIGAAYSGILVNVLLSIFSVFFIASKGYIGLKRTELSFFNEWFQIGKFAGIQIFLDNFIYAIMIVKMVNAVDEAGNYWVANNFIWGWLLVPVTCFSELIKKNNLPTISFKNTWRYGLMIAGLWVITMPFWSVFINKAMAVDSNQIMPIVMMSIPFYLTYIVSVFIDAWFISKGKTIYNMIISLIVNIVYYGIVFILFKNDLFTMNMNFIIYMFGGGMVVHMILTIILYFVESDKILCNERS
ncbi:MAG: hypothetical protein IJ593_12515 [Lachnospiraceae bacterium]|nr:hypothetical protein [Lachnospiraceae bacterium]